MAALVWAGMLARVVLPAVEFRYGTGVELDEDFGDDEVFHTAHVAHFVGPVLGAAGVSVPDVDGQLISLLRQVGRRAPGPVLWCVGVVDDQRMGLVAFHGVVESAGEALALVETVDADRYSEFWYLPGVSYPGVRRGIAGGRGGGLR